MSYDEFINGVIEDASSYYPTLFNSSKQTLYKNILMLGAGTLGILTDKLLEWKWYSPFKIARLVVAGSLIAPIIQLMWEHQMFNKKGIKATYAVTRIIDEYRDKFHNAQFENINSLRKNALDELLKLMN